MKINSIFAKTALAAAVAGVSFAASAGTLTISNPSVVANEVFGEQSEHTTIALPLTEFTPTGDLIGEAIGGSTVKLTLGGTPTHQVIFGENYQDPQQWANQGIEVKVNGAVVPAAQIKSVTGGTANDNQITIEFDAAVAGNYAAATVAVDLKGFKAKNLKNALQRLGAGSTRTSDVTLEVRSATSKFENTNNPVAFVSINGVVMNATHTDYTPGGLRARIQVAADQKQFTGTTGASAATNFSSASNVLHLGDLQLKRGTYTVPGSAPANILDAGKETGLEFDLTGQDKLFLTLNSDADFTNYGDVFLTTNAVCGAYNSGTDFRFTTGANTIQVPTAGVDLKNGTTYQLCASVSGTGGKIPQASFDASMKVTYFSPRYTESVGSHDYERVLRNGCSITLFNLPNVNAQDSAMIRFTNTSASQSGEVTVSIWSEDGQRLDQGKSVVANLAAHATAILHTNGNLEDTENRVFLGGAAADLDKFAASSGRSRIIVEGAFPSCEALGLVRSENGTLVNMTSTVYSGTANNTSNTDN